eukprot:6176034-Pleurochrysis_carterae.AAC.1
MESNPFADGSLNTEQRPQTASNLRCHVFDRSLVPSTLVVCPNASINIEVKGTLNHLFNLGACASPLLRPGDSWSVTIDEAPGSTIWFQCEIVPFIRGEIVVANADGTLLSAPSDRPSSASVTTMSRPASALPGRPATAPTKAASTSSHSAHSRLAHKAEVLVIAGGSIDEHPIDETAALGSAQISEPPSSQQELT